MIRIIFLFAYMFAFLALSGQNVSIEGFYSPTEIEVGDTSVLKVIFRNKATKSYAEGEVYVQVTFPAKKYRPIGNPEGAFLKYFSDFMEIGAGFWYGVNTSPIPARNEEGNEPAELLFIVVGKEEIKPNSSTLLATDFMGRMTDTNDTDNFRFTGLTVYEKE